MTEPTETDFQNAGPRIACGQKGALWLETRALLRLAVPLAATQLAQMAILATDTIMLGHLSKEALAAAALGNNLFILVWLMGLGPASAVPAMIAHIRGGRAGDRGGTRAVVRMGLWSALMIALPLMLFLAFTRPILIAIGQDPVLAAQAWTFMSALLWGLPFAIAYQVLRNFVTAVEMPLPPLIVAGVAVLLNALADYVLIFGHFGVPPLGLLGSGIASAFSNIFMFTVMLAFILLHPRLKPFHILAQFWRPHWAHLRELFHLGVPIGLTMLFEVALFVGAAMLMGLLGADTLAAHQIALTVPSITFMVPLGIGMAATIRVGLAAGAGDALEARRAGFAAMGVASLFMTASAATMLAFPRRIAGLWVEDVPVNAQVLALAVAFLKVAAAFQLADGLQVTASLSLRGLKDARAPMWLAGASYWLCGFPAAILLGFGLHLGGLGIWYGLALGLFVAAALLVGRFHRLSRQR